MPANVQQCEPLGGCGVFQRHGFALGRQDDIVAACDGAEVMRAERCIFAREIHLGTGDAVELIAVDKRRPNQLIAVFDQNIRADGRVRHIRRT